MGLHQIEELLYSKGDSQEPQQRANRMGEKFIGKWMELENIMLSEISLSQKVRNQMFSLIC